LPDLVSTSSEPSGGLMESRDPVIEGEVDAMPLDVVFDDAGHIDIERRQHLGRAFR
jgi:hypothetical protein